MLLQDINFTKPFDSSIYCERYINDSKGDFTNYSEVDPRYDPQGMTPVFNVPYIWIDKNNVNVFTSLPDGNLLEEVMKGEKVKFFWHPDVDRDQLGMQGYTLFQPTSSCRTMLSVEGVPFYIKTDLDKKHFRFIRRLKLGSLKHSLDINTELRLFVGSNGFPQDARYRFLPESLGFALKGGPYKDSAVLFRESRPYPYDNSCKRVVIPYHSLYAIDNFSPQDPTLLMQLCNLHGGSDPLNYFVNEIVGMIQDAWVLLLTRRGLLPELHGQNALIEIDESFEIKNLVHRDFQSLCSDREIRNVLGLPQFNKHIVGEEAGTTRESQFSIVFDNMISKYLISRLVRRFVLDFPKYDYDSVSQSVRSRFCNIPGNILNVFPETTYGFGKKAIDQVGNDVSLVDTGLLPEFR